MSNSSSKQFKECLIYRKSVEDIKRAVKIGFEALSNGTLDTCEDGADLLYKLVQIESTTTTDTKIIDNLFEILIHSGASHQINSLDSFNGTTPLMNSIACNAPITFDLLMSYPSIDLNKFGSICSFLRPLGNGGRIV